MRTKTEEEALFELRKQKVWTYIKNDYHFYGYLPYRINHFNSVFNRHKVFPGIDEVNNIYIKSLLDSLVYDNKLIIIGDHWMISSVEMKEENISEIEGFQKIYGNQHKNTSQE